MHPTLTVKTAGKSLLPSKIFHLWETVRSVLKCVRSVLQEHGINSTPTIKYNLDHTKTIFFFFIHHPVSNLKHTFHMWFALFLRVKQI